MYANRWSHVPITNEFIKAIKSTHHPIVTHIGEDED